MDFLSSSFSCLRRSSRRSPIHPREYCGIFLGMEKNVGCSLCSLTFSTWGESSDSSSSFGVILILRYLIGLLGRYLPTLISLYESFLCSSSCFPRYLYRWFNLCHFIFFFFNLYNFIFCSHDFRFVTVWRKILSFLLIYNVIFSCYLKLDIFNEPVTKNIFLWNSNTCKL